ncbi:hypothetical protein F5Y17DRAFT_221526 [Xylariaceae sp. FL0594]|nr:hypothetical protein F5Y17DRAFT_221526 [Xylariaceae sp. FL0594]
MPLTTLDISCHCGAAKQTVRLRGVQPPGMIDIDLCHCAACRHSTGLLCASYVEIENPGLREEVFGEYVSDDGEEMGVGRLFCRMCGCHVFRRVRCSFGFGEDVWGVATGTIIGEVQGGDTKVQGWGLRLRLRLKHVEMASTKDGGLGLFVPEFGHVEKKEGISAVPNLRDSMKKEEEEEVLNAHCQCGNVRFHITRPDDEASMRPRSNFPDLMVPYHSGDPEEIKNPKDETWWVRPRLSSRQEQEEEEEEEKGDGGGFGRRYLAGTCACRSCRLTSGFEIQTWAFVPRGHIFFHRVESDEEGGEETRTKKSRRVIIPLDFSTLPSGILSSYESTRGSSVRREFCPRCGATVFWRDGYRPDLLDVSVGLLDAEEGARAQTWLDWWTERVSFAEDADRGRRGGVAEFATRLVRGLEEGLGRWGGV